MFNCRLQLNFAKIQTEKVYIRQPGLSYRVSNIICPNAS